MSNYIEKIENLDLPVIRLRGIIVFPGTAISLETTEASALAALDNAAANGGLAFFVPQKKQGKAHTPCDFGTVGRIKQNLKTTDGASRVII